MRYIRPLVFHCLPTEQFPNSRFPALLYKDVLPDQIFLKRMTIRRLLQQNGWTNTRIGRVVTYHQYHSNNHMVIGILQGRTNIIVGGYQGFRTELEKGDVLIVPAGVPYKNLGRQSDVLGLIAWSGGISGDVNLGMADERPNADRRIAGVMMPALDPIYGSGGHLLQFWDPSLSRQPHSLFANRDIPGHRRN